MHGVAGVRVLAVDVRSRTDGAAETRGRDLGALEGQQEFESVFQAEAEAALADASREQRNCEQELVRREAALHRQKNNIRRSLVEYGPSPLIAEEMKSFKGKKPGSRSIVTSGPSPSARGAGP